MLILYADNDLPARAEENQYLAAALKAVKNERVSQMMATNRDHGTVAGKIAEPGDPVASAMLDFIRSFSSEREPAAPTR